MPNFYVLYQELQISNNFLIRGQSQQTETDLIDAKIAGMKLLSAFFFNALKKLAAHLPQPNAALAWQQAGNQATSGYWMYAAPVHLVLQRDTFSLAAPVPLPLETDEAQALTSALNQHFAAEGMRFFWLENRWFLRLDVDPNIATSSLEGALNKDINAFLPTGEGALRWAKFQNELQMLLFAHPVNLARERDHLPAVNSIWFDGGGTL